MIKRENMYCSELKYTGYYEIAVEGRRRKPLLRLGN